MSPSTTINFNELPMLIIVDNRRFHVHANILSRSSSLLKEYCDIRLEDGSRVPGIELPDQNPDLFNVYLQWLYGDFSAFEIPNPILDPQTVLAMLYITGEKLQDRKFRNFIIERIVKSNQRNMPSHFAINIIYNGTTRDSPARRLMVDLWQLYAGCKTLSGNHSEFVADVRRHRARGHDRFQKLALRKLSRRSTRMHRVVKPMGAPARKSRPRDSPIYRATSPDYSGDFKQGEISTVY